VTVSHTGRRILAASSRKAGTDTNGDRKETWAIHFWETWTGQEIRQITAPEGWSQALAFSPDDRTLASSGVHSAILLRDLTWQAQSSKAKPGERTAAELSELWTDLASDAAKADRAIWALALQPKQSLPLLNERLRPVAAADQKQVAQLVADLDSATFAVRSQAAKALEELGEAAEAAVRTLLEGKLTLEIRKRLELFLEKRSIEELRNLRAIDAVEHAGTPEARVVLEMVAQRTANPRVAHAASAALQRHDKRTRGG
jgi:hypothetical protein